MNRWLPTASRLWKAVFLAACFGTALAAWSQPADQSEQRAPKRSQEEKSSNRTPDLSFNPSGPNLAPNGGFTKGDKFPEGWEPMPPHVDWIDVGGEHGKVIHFNVPRDVARSYGVKYLSDYIEVKPNHQYTFNFDFKKTAKIKLRVSVEGYMENEGNRRMCYDGPIEVYATGADWTRYGRRKPVTASTPDGRPVKWFRFKLYAYGPDAGEVWWDNIHLGELTSAPAKDL
jgi:hypothetical protein